MPEPTATGEVRIRPTAGERAAFLLMCSFTPLLMSIFFTRAVLDVPWPLLVGFGLCLIGADQLVRRNGITLTEKEAVIRNPLWSVKRVRWPLVLGVTCQDGRRLTLWTAGDSPAEPRVGTPVYVSARQLEATFELVQDWWLKHRGY